MGELPEPQRVEVEPRTWLVVNLPAGDTGDTFAAELQELAEKAAASGALFVALPAGYEIETLDPVTLERAGWLRIVQAVKWRQALEAIAGGLASASAEETARAVLDA